MQKWREVTKRFAAACALLALAAGMARPAKAGGLGADTIGLFPKGVGEFAYADLKKARTMNSDARHAVGMVLYLTTATTKTS